MTTVPRIDRVFEQLVLLDGSATPRVVRDETLTVTSDYVFEDLEVGARWFLITSGDSNDNCAVTIRKVA